MAFNFRNPFGNKKIDADGNRIVEGKDEKLKRQLENDRKRQEFLSRFKLGKHNTVERQLISLGIFSGFLLVGGTISYRGWSSKQHATLSSQAIYTTNFVFSRDDQLKGEVAGVFRTEDDKTGYLLLKFKDPSQVTAAAENYKVYVSAVDQHLAGDITGDILVFGRSGYLAIRVYAPDGLPNQKWDFDLSMKNSISKTDGQLSEGADTEGAGDMFKKNNMIRVYANMGAKNATKLGNNLSSDVDQLFYAMVGKNTEKEINDKIAEETASIKTNLARIDEYRERITRLGYEAPAIPEFIKGVSVNKNGELVSKYTVPGGFNIKPGSSLAKDGYLSQFIVGKVTNDTIENLHIAKRIEAASDGTVGDGLTADLTKVRGTMNIPFEKGTENEVFAITELKTIGGDNTLKISDVSSGVSTDNQVSAAKDAQELAQLYRDVYQSVQTIQVSYNGSLIDLEESIVTEGESVSQASGTKHFIKWQQR